MGKIIDSYQCIYCNYVITKLQFDLCKFLIQDECPKCKGNRYTFESGISPWKPIQILKIRR